jgi:hypothetical protein
MPGGLAFLSPVPFFPSVSGHRLSVRVFVLLALAMACWVRVCAPARAQAVSSPLLGDAAVEASVDADSAGRAEAFPFTAAASGAGEKASLYLDGSNAARRVLVGVYANAHGHPGSLLGSGTVAAPRGSAWNSVRLNPRGAVAASHRRLALVAGRTYWLAVLGTHGTVAFRDRENCPLSLGSKQQRLRALPRSWRVGGAWPTCSISAYVSATRPSTPARRPPPAPAAGGGGRTRSTNCTPQPGRCGYPDPGFSWAPSAGAWGSGGGGVGPTRGGVSAACSSLRAAGSITTSADNQTIQNLDITGQIIVRNAHVTIDNVCVSMPGGGSSCTNSTGVGDARCWALILQPGASGTRVSNASIGGANGDSASVIGIAQDGSADPDPVFSHDYIYNCTECLHGEAWTVIDSYVVANGSNGAHGETVYMNGGTFTGDHDVFLLPSSNNLPSANMFGDVNGGSGGGCDNHWTVKNSLLADPGNTGAYVLWLCSNSSSRGSAWTDFENDDFGEPGANGIVGDTSVGQGNGGLGAYCSGATWQRNFHDSNGSPAGCG